MWPAPLPPFAVKRNNVLIGDHPLLDPVDSGIQFNLAFELYEAAVAAGATLDELYRLENGYYPPWFQAQVLVWYRGHQMVETHIQDAIARKMKADQKKKGKR